MIITVFIIFFIGLILLCISPFQMMKIRTYELTPKLKRVHKIIVLSWIICGIVLIMVATNLLIKEIQ